MLATSIGKWRQQFIIIEKIYKIIQIREMFIELEGFYIVHLSKPQAKIINSINIG